MRRFTAPVLLAAAACSALAGCGAGAAGDRAWERGDLAACVEQYRRVEGLSVVRRMRLARALAGLGDLAGARVALADLPRETWTPDGWMAEGLALLGEDRPAEAAAAFGLGAGLGGGADLLVNQCAALLAAGTPDASVCAEALVAAPQDAAAQLGLAAASLAADNPVVARRSLDGLLQNASATPAQLYEAALLSRALGDPGVACDAFERAGVALEAGESCAAAGRPDRAEALLEPLVPGEPRAAFTLGTLALERALVATDPGERERAVADAWRRLRACREAYAADPDWLNNAGRLHALDGDEQAAEVAFRQAMELGPTAAYPRLNLARLLEARGEREESGRLLEAVAALGGLTGAIAGLDLARRARDLGHPEAAIERARAVLATCQGADATPCVVEAAVTLATLLVAEDPEQAIALIEQASSIGGPAVADRLRSEPEIRRLAEDLRVATVLGTAP